MGTNAINAWCLLAGNIPDNHKSSVTPTVILLPQLAGGDPMKNFAHANQQQIQRWMTINATTFATLNVGLEDDSYTKRMVAKSCTPKGWLKACK